MAEQKEQTLEEIFGEMEGLSDEEIAVKFADF